MSQSAPRLHFQNVVESAIVHFFSVVPKRIIPRISSIIKLAPALINAQLKSCEFQQRLAVHYLRQKPMSHRYEYQNNHNQDPLSGQYDA